MRLSALGASSLLHGLPLQLRSDACPFLNAFQRHCEIAGGGRFLKTLLCVHDQAGLVVVKVYYKREDSPSLEPYRQDLQVKSLDRSKRLLVLLELKTRLAIADVPKDCWCSRYMLQAVLVAKPCELSCDLQGIKNRLSSPECTHVWPFQTFLETANAGYMLRQYTFANLYDRLSTRPFLSNLEKRWLAFQLLHGAAQMHAQGVCHGDIKVGAALHTGGPGSWPVWDCRMK